MAVVAAAIITTNTKGTRFDKAMIAATTPAIRASNTIWSSFVIALVITRAARSGVGMSVANLLSQTGNDRSFANNIGPKAFNTYVPAAKDTITTTALLIITLHVPWAKKNNS